MEYTSYARQLSVGESYYPWVKAYCDHGGCCSRDDGLKYGEKATGRRCCNVTGEVLCEPVVYGVGSSWEHNGRDDSDFYQMGYSLWTGKITRLEIGSTRYPCTIRDLPEPPTFWLRSIRAELYRTWTYRIANAEVGRIFNPRLDGYLVGKRVVLTKEVRTRATVQEPCRKCNGTGKWINPKRPTDVRGCLRCSGTGTWIGSAPKGTPMRETPAGTIGRVVQVNERRSQYGTWSYGRRCEIVTDDGWRFWAAEGSIRLEEDISSDLADQVSLAAAGRAVRLDAYSLAPTAALSMM